MTQAAKFQADLSVQLKHSVVYPGNVVEGFATVRPRVPLTAGYFHIKLVVKEQVYEAGTLHSMVLYRQVLVVQGRKELIPKYMLQNGLITAPLDELQQARAGSPFVPPGTYQFPFAFQLPVELPGTMCSNQGTHTAEIVAFVKAKFVAIDDTVSQESTAYFDIVRPRPSGFLLGKQQLRVDSDSIPLHTCCCLDRGTLMGGASVTSRVCLDQEAELLVDVRIDLQRSQQNVQSVEVSLRHQFIFSPPDRPEPLKFNLFSLSVAPVSTPLPCGQVHNVPFRLPLKRTFPPTQRSATLSSEYVVSVLITMEGFAAAGPFLINAPVEVAAVVDASDTFRLADQPSAVVLERRKDHVIVTPAAANFLFSYSPHVTPDVSYVPFPVTGVIDPRSEAFGTSPNPIPGSDLPPQLFPPETEPMFHRAWSQTTFPDVAMWGPAFAEVAKEEAGGDEGITEGWAAINSNPMSRGKALGPLCRKAVSVLAIPIFFFLLGDEV
jgi:hypothetical protein